MEEKRNASPTKANGDNCMSDSECISGNCDAVMFACMAAAVELIATPSSFL